MTRTVETFLINLGLTVEIGSPTMTIGDKIEVYLEIAEAHQLVHITDFSEADLQEITGATTETVDLPIGIEIEPPHVQTMLKEIETTGVGHFTIMITTPETDNLMAMTEIEVATSITDVTARTDTFHITGIETQTVQVDMIIMTETITEETLQVGITMMIPETGEITDPTQWTEVTGMTDIQTIETGLCPLMNEETIGIPHPDQVNAGDVDLPDIGSVIVLK